MEEIHSECMFVACDAIAVSSMKHIWLFRATTCVVLFLD